MRRQQIDDEPVTLTSIMSRREFRRGFDDVRAGVQFNPNNDSWDYERGRLFGCIAPLNMPLYINGKLNPKAVKLAEMAVARN